jgi:hypothetical protein
MNKAENGVYIVHGGRSARTNMTDLHRIAAEEAERRQEEKEEVGIIVDESPYTLLTREAAKFAEEKLEEMIMDEVPIYQNRAARRKAEREERRNIKNKGR